MPIVGGDWVVFRPDVVRSVAARVPGVDAEEAASRALEEMVRIVSTGGIIDDPASYWRRAAVDEAISMTREMTREAGRAHPVGGDTLDSLTIPVAGAGLDPEDQADVSMLCSAVADLTDDDRQILFDRHVYDRAVTTIAAGLDVRPHAVTMRLRRAEERLARAFAAAHARSVKEPECRTTRAAMHDYLKGRLPPLRQRRLEVHLDGCAECTRAFIDVRDVSWMLRDLGQHVVAGAVVTGTVGTGAVAVGVKPRSFGKWEASVAAGVLAVLAISGGAVVYIASQPDQPSVQAIDGSGPDGAGGGTSPTSEDPTTKGQPPSILPAGPAPRPATTPKLYADTAPDPVAPAAEPPPVTEPVPEPEDTPEPPSAGSVPDITPDPQPDRGSEELTPAEPADSPAGPAGPAPEDSTGPPGPDLEPEPDMPPAPSSPQEDSGGGPPGNPDNENGTGPVKDTAPGPGNSKGTSAGQQQRLRNRTSIGG